jgi:DNA-binding MarR family transcriptional regulator
MDTTADDATDAEWPFPDPDDVVGWTLVRAGHALSRAFTRELAEVGLKPHIFGILAQVRRDPGLSSAELARHVLVTPQSMGELLRRMAADGLVEYTPPQRGRRMRVHLTDTGSALLDRAFAVVGTMNAPAYLGLSADEATHLNTLLHKVLSATS